jgi:hypothetical protein
MICWIFNTTQFQVLPKAHPEGLVILQRKHTQKETGTYDKHRHSRLARKTLYLWKLQQNIHNNFKVTQ